MPKLAIFTVKQFRRIDGRYWTYGGFGNYLRSLAPHFEKIVLACHPKDAREAPPGWYPVNLPNVEYHWLPYYEGEPQCLMRLPKMFLDCRSAVERVDIVNARMPDYSGVCGAYWARRLGKPLFVSLVDDWHAFAKNMPTRLRGPLRLGLQAHLKLYCVMERRMCEGATVFAQGASLLERYSGHNDLHALISTSFDAGDVVSRRAVAAVARGLHVVSVGRLVTIKGHDLFLRAIAAACRAQPGRFTRVTIAGEGPRLVELMQLAADLGIESRVRFVGQVGRDELFALLDTADIMCHPSLGEGTPKVLLEAMARGVPVIATDVGGVSSVVVDGVTGLLVLPGRVDALAAALERMSEDAVLRQMFSDAGREFAREHSSERVWGGMVRTVQARFPALSWPSLRAS